VPTLAIGITWHLNGLLDIRLLDLVAWPHHPRDCINGLNQQYDKYFIKNIASHHLDLYTALQQIYKLNFIGDILMLKELEKLAAPAQKLAELNKATVEKLAAAQKTAVEEAVALTEARVKAAAQIKDVEGLQAFVKEQIELAQNGYEKAVAEARVLIEDIQAYNAEVVKLIQEGNTTLAQEVQKTVKEVAKKAA